MSKGIKLLSHNIQGGIERKLLFNDVLDNIALNDVVFLQETWLVDSNQLNVSGFSIFRSDRGSHKKKHSGSGGVVTLYKTHLSKGLSKIPSKHKDFMWVKFDRNFFNMTNDLYIINCYIPPEDSVVHIDTSYDILEVLFEEVSKFSRLGYVGIAGDLNARTGNTHENLIGHNFDVVNEFDRICVGTNNHCPIHLPFRQNRDKIRNSFGSKLIEIIEANNMVILNGRVMGDSFGEKTCFTHNGSSTVDYFILSEPLVEKVNYMQVRPQTWYSDHSPLELSLSLDIMPTTDIQIPLKKLSSFLWDEEGKEKFQNILTNDDSVQLLSDTLKYNTIDECVESLTNFLHSCASKSLKPKKNSKVCPRKTICTTEKPELQRAKLDFNKSWRNVRLYRDKVRHIKFVKARSRYKRLKYLYFNYNKEDKLYKLANIESKDPKGFWKTIKSFTKKQVEDSTISPKSWMDYFKGLFNVKSTNIDNAFLDYVKNALPTVENISNTGPLDYEI